MKYLLYLILTAVLLSTQCGNRDDNERLLKYNEKGRQLLNLNELKTNGEQWEKPIVVKKGPDSITIGQEFRAVIYLTEKEPRIVEAYFDCESVSDASVDTLTFDVSGCSKKLFIQNDTVLIGFRPAKEGEIEFPRITLLTVDRNRIFRTVNYSFKYKVVAP